MKRILAFVRPTMLDDVVLALHEIEDFPGVSMAEVKGLGRSFSKRVREKKTAVFGYPEYVRMEIVCRQDQVEEILLAIEKGARTGRSGDGKIFVSPVENAVRISSGEQGPEAL